MKPALGLMLAPLLAIAGCAGKKPAIAKVVRHIDARPGNVVRFEGVKDGHCVIACIKLDAKLGYTIICK